MAIFKSIKCFLVEAYSVLCVSTIAPVPTTITPAPTEVTTSVPATPAPKEVSTVSGAIVHVPAGALVLYTSVPIVSVTAVPTLSPAARVQLSEWDNSVWLSSEVGQQVEAMAEEIIRHELFCEEYFGKVEEVRAKRNERKLALLVEAAEAKEAARPTYFSWDEWNELTLAEQAVAPLPAVVCSTVGSTVYTTALVAGGAAIYALGIMPMSAGMALVALLGTMMLAPTGVIVAAMRISELNGHEVITFTSGSDDD